MSDMSEGFQEFIKGVENMMTTGEKLEAIRKYGYFIENGKKYTICSACKKLVRMDKPIIGSLHLCG